MNLKIGDTVTVNVLGRNVTARIANLRAVDWQSLGINFVLVFSPGTFAGAPHTDIATLTFVDGGTQQRKRPPDQGAGRCFPTVSAVRVKDALDAVDRIVGNLVSALRGASAVTLIAAALVLGGALAAGQRFRIYDAVILRTLGATRLRLLVAYALEYLLHRPCRGGVRRRRRHACRLAGRHPRYGVSVRLGAGPGIGGGVRCASYHRHTGSCRHVCRARPQASGSAKEFVDGR